MKIAIIGTSRITEDHIKVLTKLRNKIVSISSTRKNSKNLKLLAKKFKIKKTFNNWQQSIKYVSKIKNCNFLITTRIQDNLKVLKACTKFKRYIFIEKPVFLSSKIFNKIKNNKKIFVGYNRIFYKNVNIVKTKLNKKKNINVLVKCPENNKQNIVKNSCHIISILFYIFGDLKLDRKNKNKNFINCLLRDKKNSHINLIFNLSNSDNFSIEIFDEKKRYLLLPIEKLKIFKKIKIKKEKNNFIYEPKEDFTLDEYNVNKYKPGFEKQIKNFIHFSKGRNIINNFSFSKKIVKLCEQIVK